MDRLDPQAGETERERFAALVTAHSRAMFRVARAILDDDADAEDAVGQAVLLAWQSFHRLRRPEAARAWLIKIAVNCAYEQRRKYGRLVPLDAVPEAAGAAEDPHPDSLWDAVRALPEEARAAVVLFYYEDMTVAEIAKALGIAQGTVKSRLNRARQRLKTMLEEE